jgi:hypothetical protein
MSGNTIKDDRPRLIGGPRDGSTISPGTRPTFIWVGGTVTKPRVFADPAAGRDLYRCVEVKDGRAHFMYAGDTHHRCRGCDAYVTKKPKCAFCGTRAKQAESAR